METIKGHLASILARRWWLLLLRGLIAIAFGVVSWVQPGISLASLVLLFGAYSLVDGVLNAWAALEGRREHEHWWVLFLEGLLGMGVGELKLLDQEINALEVRFD